MLDVPFAMRARRDRERRALGCGARRVRLRGRRRCPRRSRRSAPQPYSWEPHVQRELDGDARAARRRSPPATIVLRAAPAGGGARDRRARRPRARPGFLLADDVGLGKTITAWEAVLAMPSGAHACSSCARSRWSRTGGARSRRWATAARTSSSSTTIGSASCSRSAPRRARRSARRRASRAPAPRPSSTSIVCDESHRCKNPTAARSKLAAKLVASAGFCLWLSATAGPEPARAVVPRAAARERHRRDAPRTSRTSSSGASTRGSASRAARSASGSGAAIARDCEKVRALLFDAARGRAGRDPPPPRGHRGLAGDQPHPHADRARRRGARALRAGVDRVPPRDGARAARPRSEVGARGDRCGCARRARSSARRAPSSSRASCSTTAIRSRSRSRSSRRSTAMRDALERGSARRRAR